ncbi:Uncharacterised protein [uncultured archaeon]|nr:Uncharacterised protein [uncultured archaeon]
MTQNLQQTINWARTFIQYNPLTAGLGLEPASSVASMIRNSLLNPPLTWLFNRGEVTFSTVVGTQDYTLATISDMAFIEKISLSDDSGNIWEIKDVYNNAPLAVSSFQQRPSAVSVMSSSIISNVLNYKLRFLGVPDQIYAVTLTYQKLSPQFGPFQITAVGNASGGNTAYTGIFDVISFPVSSLAIITGCAAPVNNGTFLVVSCTNTTLTVANAAGVAASSQTGYANNWDWAPIPEQYSDIYNNLFLSEMLAVVDDARAQLYRQRGVAALFAKATGLTETQKNAFAQQWLARGVERQSVLGSIQTGTSGRSV